MKRGKLLVMPTIGWLTVFFALPLILVVLISFLGRTPYGQLVFNFTLENYLRSQGVINSFLLSSGLIERPLALLYNDGAVFLGLVYAMLPFMVLPVYVSIEQLDIRLLEAASDLGATPIKTFLKVTLPLTIPGIAAGSILVFISTLGMFVVPDIMGGAKSSLIGNLIQNQFLSARNWPFGSALSILLAFLSMLLIYLYYKALGLKKKELSL